MLNKARFTQFSFAAALCRVVGLLRRRGCDHRHSETMSRRRPTSPADSDGSTVRRDTRGREEASTATAAHRILAPPPRVFTTNKSCRSIRHRGLCVCRIAVSYFYRSLSCLFSVYLCKFHGSKWNTVSKFDIIMVVKILGLCKNEKKL